MSFQDVSAQSSRYIESGVVFLSHLEEDPHPDPFHSWCPLCMKDQKRLEGLLKDDFEQLEHWLPMHRLRAEVSGSFWSNRKLLEKIPSTNGTVYNCWKLPKRCITRGIPFLKLLRSLSTMKLEPIYGSHRPWIVVDFHLDDESGSHRKAAFLRSPHRAIQAVFDVPKQQPRAHPFAISPLLPSHIKDAKLIAKTGTLLTSIQPLLKMPILWLAPTLGHISELRKTWFHEECSNYLNYMTSQWKDLLLDENPAVRSAVNHTTIKALQSRVPQSSESDLAFIRDQFSSREFLPVLRDAEARKRVEEAVCRSRGPFLTFHTLAADLRLLMSMQKRLKPLADTDMHRNKDTVRQRMEKLFKIEFNKLYRASSGPMSNFDTDADFAAKCYEALFLFLLRTTSSKTPVVLDPVGRPELQSLAERVFQSSPDSPDDVISTTVPAGWSSEPTKLNDTPVDSRHGMSLFEDPEASHFLFSDRIRMPCLMAPSAGPAFLGRDIACILLYGVSARSDVRSAAAWPTTASQYSDDAAKSLAVAEWSPRLPRSSAAGSSADSTHVDGFGYSTSSVSDGQVFRGELSRGRDLVRQSWTVRSQRAVYSRAGNSETSEETEPSQRQLKRPRLSPEISSCVSESSHAVDRGSQNATRPRQRSPVESPGSTISLHGTSNSLNDQDLSRSPVGSSVYTNPPPRTEEMPRVTEAFAMHEQDHAYITEVTYPYESSKLCNDTADWKLDHGPRRTSQERSAGVSCSLKSASSRHQVPTSPGLALSIRSRGGSPDKRKPGWVRFHATGKAQHKEIYVKFIDHYLRAFYVSQQVLDRDSKDPHFWHWQTIPGEKNKRQKRYTSYDDLREAIIIDRPDVVFVHSDKLGTTDGQKAQGLTRP